jgi:hypothetical protein
LTVIGSCTIQGYAPWVAKLVHMANTTLTGTGIRWSLLTDHGTDAGKNDPTQVVDSCLDDWWVTFHDWVGYWPWDPDREDHLGLYEQQVSHYSISLDYDFILYHDPSSHLTGMTLMFPPMLG